MGVRSLCLIIWGLVELFGCKFWKTLQTSILMPREHLHALVSSIVKHIIVLSIIYLLKTDRIKATN